MSADLDPNLNARDSAGQVREVRVHIILTQTGAKQTMHLGLFDLCTLWLPAAAICADNSCYQVKTLSELQSCHNYAAFPPPPPT